jgi:hypothetical protein
VYRQHRTKQAVSVPEREREPELVIWLSAQVRAHIDGEHVLIECAHDDSEGIAQLDAVLRLLSLVNGARLQWTQNELGNVADLYRNGALGTAGKTSTP